MSKVKNCRLDGETIGNIRNDRRRFLKIISSLATAAYVAPAVVTLSLSEAYGDEKKLSGHHED